MSFVGVWPTGFPTIILSCLQDSGPGGYPQHHLWGPTLRPHCRHGLLPHHVFCKTPEVNLTHTHVKSFFFPGRCYCFCSLCGVFFFFNRYWSLIDDTIRAAAFERKVKIRMLISCGKASDPAMLPFLQSLAALDNHKHGISVQIVRAKHIVSNDFSCFNFFFSLQKLYIVPVGNQTDIPYSRVNHNKYMVTDKVAYIGE